MTLLPKVMGILNTAVCSLLQQTTKQTLLIRLDSVREKLNLFFRRRSIFSVQPASEQMDSIQPMRILAIDGGGLQGVSTLLILNKVLENIGKKQNGENPKKPRPCDVFDTIWLAILLGHFRLDITSCLSEWYTMVDRITSSKAKELSLRMLQRCYVDTNRLVKQFEELPKLDDRGEFVFEPNPE